MTIAERTGIKQPVFDCIAACAASNGLEKVALFGSRARGDNGPRSDIDLACSGGNFARFALETDEVAPTLLEFDFVDLDGSVDARLLDSIEREGAVLHAQAG